MRKFQMATLMLCLSLTLTACTVPTRDAATHTTSAVTTVAATETPTTTVTTTTQAPTATKKKSTTTKKKTTTTKKKTTTTKKRTTTTAKPVHQHSYTNYVCTGCGAIDKTHSFEYLSNWLIDNGTVEGNYACIEFNPKADNPLVYCNASIRYYPESMDADECIAFAYYEKEYESDIYFQVMLFLYQGFGESYYIAQGGLYEIEEYGVTGYIPIAKYTTNRPISYESCELAIPYETNVDMLDGVRIDINNTLSYAKQLLKDKKVGITLADLGFTSF